MAVAANTILPSSQITELRFVPDKRLLRAGLLMLLFMTAAFGAATWNAMQDLASQVKALPVVLFAIVCILVARLYTQVDKFAAAPNARIAELSALHMDKLAQVPPETRNEIWHYWDKNGAGKTAIEHVSSSYGMAASVVQHLLEHYDVRWREQVAMLYCDNPENEYMARLGTSMEGSQIAEDARRLKSGLPLYPVAGVWLCSDCSQRPCRCA